MKQDTQSRALGQLGRMEWGREVGGGSGWGGHLYTCDRFILIYDKNYHKYCKLSFKINFF